MFATWCNSRHHISICDEGISKKTIDDKENATKGNEKKLNVTGNARSDGIDRTTFNFAGNENKNSILLQTAVGYASCVGKQYYKKIRIMFDSGSQRTYITSSLRNQLRLPKLRNEHLIIQAFGGTENNVEKVDVVQLKLKGNTNETEVYLEAICIPTICSPLMNQAFDLSECREQYKHLADLQLADDQKHNEGMTIDLLIGLDFYFSMMDGEIRRGERGPVALRSIFGWVLCVKYQG